MDPPLAKPDRARNVQPAGDSHKLLEARKHLRPRLERDPLELRCDLHVDVDARRAGLVAEAVVLDRRRPRAHGRAFGVVDSVLDEAEVLDGHQLVTRPRPEPGRAHHRAGGEAIHGGYTADNKAIPAHPSLPGLS